MVVLVHKVVIYTYNFPCYFQRLDDIIIHIDGMNRTDPRDNFNAETFFQPLLCHCSCCYSTYIYVLIIVGNIFESYWSLKRNFRDPVRSRMFELKKEYSEISNLSIN